MEYTLRNIDNQDWISLVFIGVFVIIACTRYLYPQRFREFILLPVTDRYFALQGKGYELNHPFNVLFFMVQILSFASFFFLLLKFTNPESQNSNPWLFVQLLTVISVFILVKYFIERIIGNLFNIEKLIDRYLYEKLNYASLLSLFILIGNVVFFYVLKEEFALFQGFGAITLLLFLITLLSSFKRNWALILRHFFYFILYLCALEIAPFVILYKLVV